MLKLLFKKKNSLRVTNSMGTLLFSHFRVTNVKLINEKNPLNITVSWLPTVYNNERVV